jgi:cytoskeletal protein RodZ
MGFLRYTPQTNMQSKESNKRFLKRLKWLLLFWIVLFLAAMLLSFLGSAVLW